MFEFENVPKAQEQYLLTIFDIKKHDSYYLIVPSRKDLSILTDLLDNERFYVSNVDVLSKVKDYNELIKELKEKNKPDDLNFG